MTVKEGMLLKVCGRIVIITCIIPICLAAILANLRGQFLLKI